MGDEKKRNFTPGEELAFEMMQQEVEWQDNRPPGEVERFAIDLKERIERAAVAFDQPGQSDMVAGLRYVKGIVDAAITDHKLSMLGLPPVSPNGHP